MDKKAIVLICILFFGMGYLNYKFLTQGGGNVYVSHDKSLCRKSVIQQCGSYLSDCNSGKEYSCQTNVTVIKYLEGNKK